MSDFTFISIPTCHMSTFCHCDKILRRNNLKGQGFIVAHDFTVFNAWLLGPTTMATERQNITAGRVWHSKAVQFKAAKSREEKKVQGQYMTFQGHALHDILPLSKTHFPKYLPPPIAVSVDDKAFHTRHGRHGR